jgi:N-acetylmuramoyl-L-alanine amidase-like protein
VYLTNLATIARRAGLSVVEQSGWQSRGHGGMIDVRAVICHHTAGGSGNTASLGVVQNGRSDLPGPLSHFLLAKDGTVYVVAAGLCYHAGATLASWQSNAHSIGIEAERSVADINARVPWPERQLVAYAKLCRALQDAFGGVPVLGHKEICSPPGRKIDPDFDMAAFRGRVASADQEDDVQLTDDIKLFDGNTIKVQQLLAGLFSRVADPVIESARFPGHKDTLANFVKAIDGNVLGLADGIKALTTATRDTNAKLDKLIELLTPKTEA